MCEKYFRAEEEEEVEGEGLYLNERRSKWRGLKCWTWKWKKRSIWKRRLRGGEGGFFPFCGSHLIKKIWINFQIF